MELTAQEKIERIKDFRPIDDIFFELLAQDIEVCQEILRVILKDDKLIVKDSIVQSDVRNIYGRSVRLDALCILGNGVLVNIEVQRADNDDHLRRVRFNASSITVKDSNTGDRFENVKDVYVVYISENDFLAKGRTIYHINKVIEKTGDIIDDGLHEIFVNAQVNDKTEIAELMECFTQKEVNNPKFPKLSGRVTEIKTTEGGATSMCELMEKYNKEAADKAVLEEKARTIGILIKKRNMTFDEACDFLFIPAEKKNAIKEVMPYV